MPLIVVQKYNLLLRGEQEGTKAEMVSPIHTVDCIRCIISPYLTIGSIFDGWSGKLLNVSFTTFWFTAVSDISKTNDNFLTFCSKFSVKHCVLALNVYQPEHIVTNFLSSITFIFLWQCSYFECVCDPNVFILFLFFLQALCIVIP